MLPNLSALPTDAPVKRARDPFNPPKTPNAPRGPNAFQRQLLRDPKVINRLGLKESRRRGALADKRREYAKDYLDRTTMCKKVAKSRGNFGKFDWMGVLSELEERNKETLKQVAELRKQLKYERFPLESWETEEAELEEAEFE